MVGAVGDVKGAAGAPGEDAKRGTQQFARVPEGVVTGAVHFAEAAVGVVNGGGGAVAVAKVCGAELAQGVGRGKGVIVVADKPVGVVVEGSGHALGEAAGAAAVLFAQNEMQTRVVLPCEPGAGAVSRGVIDNDDGGKGLGEGRCQGVLQFLAAVMSDDDGSEVHKRSSSPEYAAQKQGLHGHGEDACFPGDGGQVHDFPLLRGVFFGGKLRL